MRDWLLDVLKQATGQLRDEQVKQARVLKRRATELSKQRDRLMTLYLEDEVNTAMFREMKDSLQDQVEAALSRLGSEESGGSGIAERAFDFAQDPVEGWRQLSMGGKQRILRTVSTRRTLSSKCLHMELRKPFSLLTDRHRDNTPWKSLTDRHRWILTQLRRGVKLTRSMVEDEFGIGERQAKRTLGPLANCGMIRFVRSPRPGHYALLIRTMSANAFRPG